MRGRPPVRLTVVALLASTLASVAVTTAPRTARADDASAAPNAERLKSAAAEFDAGRRAYLASDYATAAVHFENAYHDAPRAESMRSAIRAHRAAKELARAATLAAVARVKYASDAPTVTLANDVLTSAAASLHEVRIACTPECGVASDGRAISTDDATALRLFLDAGHHELTVSWPRDRSTRVTVDAKAGGSDAFTLAAPVPKPTPAVPIVVAPAVRDPKLGAPVVDAKPPRMKPLSPVFVIIGASLTAVGVGATIVSGLDAVNNPGADVVRQRCVGLGAACPEYQQGRNAQTRTNVILAATGATFVATAVVGLFFTQWTKPSAPADRTRALELHVTPSFATSGAGVAINGAF